MPTITQTELLASGVFVSFGDADILDVTGACTFMVYADITDGVDSTVGYIFSKGLSSGTFGPRIQFSESYDRVDFVIPSTSSNLAPSHSTANDTWEVDGGWVNYAFTYDGSDDLDNGIVPYVDASVSDGNVGAGTPNIAGNTVEACLFNRSVAHDRGLAGSCAYFAKWNRVLSATEIANARINGPLSVSDGLIFCWANGQDYGPSSLTPTSRSTFAAGSTPPNTALGDTGTALVASGITSTAVVNSSSLGVLGELSASGISSSVVIGSPSISIEGALDASGITSPPIIGITLLETDTLELVSSGDANNSHPTNSFITNPGLSEPTVNIEVRVVYTAWRQCFFRLNKSLGKRPLFKITNPGNCVDTFRSSWRPWYSYDGINWLRFDTAPVDNTTSWDWQNSTAFTQNTVYIGYQPAWPVWRAPWLIGELETIDADLIHELSSAPGYEYPTGLTAQYDELSRLVVSQKMYAFGIWDDTLSPADSSQKRIAIITGGVHAGEHVGSWGMEGFLRFLLGGSEDATTLLSNFKFYIYPMCNPMGRYMGHYRGQRQVGSYTLDPNRDWPADNSASTFQSTQFLRSMIETDMDGNDAAFFMDFHATWGTNVAFYYYEDDFENADYLTEWAARVSTYSTLSGTDGIVDTTICSGINRTYNPNHCYISETYESSAFAGGISDVSNIGVVFAEALSDTPLSELRLPAGNDISGSGIESVISISSSSLGQVHTLVASGIQSTPSISDSTIGQDGQLAGIGLLSPISTGNAPLGQIHGLSATGLASDCQLSIVHVVQIHDIHADEMSSQPSCGTSELSQSSVSVAIGLSSRAIVGHPQLSQIHVLGGDGVGIVPSIFSANIAQEHNLSLNEISSHGIIGSTNIVPVSSLVCVGLSSFAEIGVSVIDQKQVIHSNGIESVSIIGNPVLSQIHGMTGLGILSQGMLGVTSLFNFEEGLFVRNENIVIGTNIVENIVDGKLLLTNDASSILHHDIELKGIKSIFFACYGNFEVNEV